MLYCSCEPKVKKTNKTKTLFLTPVLTLYRPHVSTNYKIKATVKNNTTILILNLSIYFKIGFELLLSATKKLLNMDTCTVKR